MATLLWVKGRYAEAEPLAREAVEFTVQTRPPNHPMLPNNQAWWGRALVGVGNYPKALDVMEQSVAGYKRLRPAGHQDLALPLIGLGAALRGLGRLAESERALREAEVILRNFPALKDRTADMAGELGLTLRAMGRDAEATVLFRQSFETLLALFGPAHPLTVQAKERLGAVRR
jgi:tetratricopeptide (TPR) repeat protein